MKNPASSVIIVSVIIAFVIFCFQLYQNYQEDDSAEKKEWIFDTDKMSREEVRDAIENAFQWLEKEENQQPSIQWSQPIQIWRGIRNMGRTNALISTPSPGKFSDIIEKAIEWLENKDYEVSLEGKTLVTKHSIIVNTMYSPLDKYFENQRLQNYWSGKKRCLQEHSETNPEMQPQQCLEKKIMEKPWIECAAKCFSMEMAINEVKKSQDEYKEAMKKAIQWWKKDEIFSEESGERPTVPTVDDVFDDLVRTFDTINWALEKWLEKKRSTCSFFNSKREQYIDL